MPWAGNRWGLLWGAAPVLPRRFLPGRFLPGRFLPVPAVLIGLFWLDPVAMPRMAPLLELGPHWIIGEPAGLLFVALPAIPAGRWSADRIRLWPRVGLGLWLTPLAASELGGGAWPREQVSTLVQIGCLTGVPAVAAVAAIHEGEQLRGRHGQRWVDYRGQVRDWVPRLRPYCAVPAVLFLGRPRPVRPPAGRADAGRHGFASSCAVAGAV